MKLTKTEKVIGIIIVVAFAGAGIGLAATITLFTQGAYL